MRKSLRLAMVRPASVLFVDLMASTFAVFFLILVVSLLSESEEVAEEELARPRPRSAGDFKLNEGVLTADSAEHDHPFAEYTETVGEIELYDEWIRFYDETDPELGVVQDSAEFLDANSLFRRFLERLKRRDPERTVHLTVFGNGNFYKVFDLLAEYQMNWSYRYSWSDDAGSAPAVPDQEKEGIFSVAEVREEVIRASRQSRMRESGSETFRSTQERPAGLENLASARSKSQKSRGKSLASRYLERFLVENRHLDLWKFLTEKIYRAKGYDAHYQTHRAHLTFYAGDLEEIFGVQAGNGGRKRPELLILAIILAVTWFYREVSLPPRRNRL